MEIFGQTITLSNRFKIISHSKKIKAIIALGPFSSLGMNVQSRRNQGEGVQNGNHPPRFWQEDNQKLLLKKRLWIAKYLPTGFSHLSYGPDVCLDAVVVQITISGIEHSQIALGCDGSGIFFLLRSP